MCIEREREGGREGGRERERKATQTCPSSSIGKHRAVHSIQDALNNVLSGLLKHLSLCRGLVEDSVERKPQVLVLSAQQRGTLPVGKGLKRICHSIILYMLRSQGGYCLFITEKFISYIHVCRRVKSGGSIITFLG